MKKEDARLMAVSSLEFDDYMVYLPVLNDEIAFSSLIKFQDKRCSNTLNIQIIDQLPANDENDSESETDQINNLKAQIEQLQTEKSNLQLQNNTLSTAALDFETRTKAIQDDKDQIIKKKEDDFKAEKNKLYKIIKDKDVLIENMKVVLKNQENEIEQLKDPNKTLAS